MTNNLQEGLPLIMTNSNTVDTIGQEKLSVNQLKPRNIEKFHGPMSDEKYGCTVIVNATIKILAEKDLSSLGLYSFICSLPDTWELNIEHIKKTLGIGREKLSRCLKDLIELGLLHKTALRDEGRFSRNAYTCRLRANQPYLENNHINQHQSPLTGLPSTDNPPLIYHNPNISIKEFSLIGNLQSSESTIANPTFFKKEEQSQDPILDHMLAHSYGCSPEKVKAYRAHRGYRMSIKTWDSAVKIYLEICFKQSTPISPDQGLDALLKRTDCCTDFDTIFPGTKHAANICAFSKEAAGYDLARGQDIAILMRDFKRIGTAHNLPEDFDYQAYYAERGRKEAAERNAETLRTSNAHNNPYSGNSDVNQQTATLKSKEAPLEGWRAEMMRQHTEAAQRIIDSRESNKTPSKINTEMTMDDSKGSAAELQERTVMLTTELCEEPIAIADCDSALDMDDFISEEQVAPLSVSSILSVMRSRKKPSVETSDSDVFQGYGKPVILFSEANSAYPSTLEEEVAQRNAKRAASY